MSLLLKATAIASILTFSSQVLAIKAPPQFCPEIIDRVAQTQIHQVSNQEKTDCYISAANTNNYVNLIYRSFVVSNDSLMVFVSLGDGPEDKTTGAKEFYFFPRDQRMAKYSVSNDAAEMTIHGRFDVDFIINTESSQLVDMTNGKLKVDPRISADNDGGVFITPTKGLVFELPFKLGSAPSADLRRNGLFKDAFNNKCSVRIGTIFKATGDGDTVIKYNDFQLKNALAKLCPQIKY